MEGIYNGTDIGYSLDGLTELQELALGATLSFDFTIINTKGVKTDNLFYKFNFIEKTGTEILPGTDPEKTQYEITFVPNNGQSPHTVTVDDGSLLPEPADPIREGYTFTGWYKDVGFVAAWDFANDKVTSNTTLYAGWSLNGEEPDPEPPAVIQYEVLFKYGNGSSDMTVLVDDGALLPKPADPTRNGYTFTGWYRDSSGTLAWNFETDTVDSNTTLYAGWRSNSANDEYHTDFFGLVEALLSESNNCLNDSDVIFNAVMTSFKSKDRDEDDAPIVHCSVNSVSGGTMSAIAEFANSNLTDDLHFIFEADPDPAYRNTRMRLYMYYEHDIDAAADGENIVVYKQIVTMDDDGVWHADGTYIGYATVGDYFGGGKNGKDVRTIDAYSWKAGELVS